MPIKPPVPFHMLDNDTGWEQVPGGAPGVQQKMLSGELDEDAKIGVRTRLIRFLPGTVAPNVFLHDYWEEV
ncbi:MAG: cupin, partial [Pseudomonadota bacterium]|nr:cupin [Pseudomonadota bacterium]